MIPVAEEPFTYGYHTEMEHFTLGIESRPTLVDGYIDNAVIDAACASVESQRWEPVDLSALRLDDDR